MKEITTREGFERMTVYQAIWKNKIPARDLEGRWLIDTHHPLYKEWVQQTNEFKERYKGNAEKGRERFKEVYPEIKDTVRQHQKEVWKERKERPEV